MWAWWAIDMAILVIGTLAVARSIGLFERLRAATGLGPWILVLAVLCFPPVVGELVLGNVHILLFGLFAIAWLGLRQGDRAGERWSGIAVGIATVIKVFPGLVIVWFLLTGRRKAAAWSVVGAFAFIALTLPVAGFGPWLDFPAALLNLSSPSDTTDTLAPTVWLAGFIGFGWARVAITGLALAILAWTARRLPTRRGFVVAVLLSVLVAPALYHHYLAILVLPFLLLLAEDGALPWLALAYLLMSGGEQAALGDLSWIVNRAMPTAGALVLLSGRPPTLPGARRRSACRALAGCELVTDRLRVLVARVPIQLAAPSLAGLIVVVWFASLVPTQNGFGYDAYAYWDVRLADIYGRSFGQLTAFGAFRYAPPIAALFAPFHLLPWPVFLGLWVALLWAALAWLGGRWTLAACVFVGIPWSIYEGNVDLLLAVLVVAGLRWPAVLSLAILAKATTAIVLVWFLLRRDWRSLGISLAALAALVLLTLPFTFDQWPRYFAMLADNAGAPESAWIGLRVLVAIGLISLASVTNRAWLVGVAAAVAQPTLTIRSLAVVMAAVGLILRPGWLSPAQQKRHRDPDA